MKQKNSKKTFIVIISTITVILVLYTLIGIYENRTGSIRSEFTFKVTENEAINVQGIVFRDEYNKKGKTNEAIILGNVSDIYSPVVSDGESIAKGDTIAYVFDSESQLEAYEEITKLKKEVDNLTKLQDKENIEYLDVNLLNSEISNVVSEYVKICDENHLSSIDSVVTEINYKIASKQIIAGKKLNFSSDIEKLSRKIKKLNKKIKEKKEIKAPFAGYFVSHIDGYESLCKYSDISENGISPDNVEKLLSQEIKSSEKAYGKIINQHSWFFVFNMKFTDSSKLKLKNSVTVDFPEKGIENVPMTISSINRDGNKVAVVLKCMTMNEDLLGLRIENAKVNISNHTGCKINSDALKSENGVVGVYVHSGNIAIFKPIEVLYSADGYVVAQPLILNEEKNNGGAADSSHTLKPYDKIILKGRNLYDGKVIS
ncbi:MAG: hypothetical protein IJ262_05960 [Clostridia bacterium]|nr:hypothetical protein [Clostridia bacterium]